MVTHEIITSKALLPVHFDIYHTSKLLVPSHWHTHLEILYLLQGTMQIVRYDDQYTLHTGDLFVVNSGDIHYTQYSGNVEIMLLQIPYEFLNQCISHYNTITFKEYYSSQELSMDTDFQRMVELLLLMGQQYKQGEEGYQFLFSSNLHLFLHILYTHYSTHQLPVERSKDVKHLMRLRETITYVEQHYMEAITLTSAASMVALNPEYFCRSFKKYMGFSFMEYVNLVRLSHIHSDILGTDNSLTDIRERHGFSNYKVFSRMFKEAYGCSPSKLRDR